MNWTEIESSWKDYQINAKQKWDKLTDELLAATLGKRESLSSKVQEAYGITKEETEKQVAAWQSSQIAKPQAQPQAVKN